MSSKTKYSGRPGKNQSKAVSRIVVASEAVSAGEPTAAVVVEMSQKMDAMASARKSKKGGASVLVSATTDANLDSVVDQVDGVEAEPAPLARKSMPMLVAAIEQVVTPAEDADQAATVAKGKSAKAAGRKKKSESSPPVVAVPQDVVVAVAVPEVSKYSIHQIYFKPEQLAGLDPSFIPYDNGASTDLLREFTVFEKLATEHAKKQDVLWGALSWRFEEKTGLKGSDFLKMIEDKPGHDLYYCNPYPENEALYLNGWQQGSVSHPALIELCSAIFSVTELDKRDLHSIQPSVAFSACNYFVGTAKFWDSYVPWVRSIIDASRSKLPEAVLHVLDSSLSDPSFRHVNSTYWPFLVERLLPLFLRKMGNELKVCKLPVPRSESKLSVHLQRLREMKDMACKTRSRWLYTCWLSYRNLYMQQIYGREWCQRYLPSLTNAEAEFW